MRLMRAEDNLPFDGTRDFYQPYLFKELNTNKLLLRWSVSTEGCFLGLELGMPRSDHYLWPRFVWQRSVPPPPKRELR